MSLNNADLLDGGVAAEGGAVEAHADGDALAVAALGTGAARLHRDLAVALGALAQDLWLAAWRGVGGGGWRAGVAGEAGRDGCGVAAEEELAGFAGQSAVVVARGLIAADL